MRKLLFNSFLLVALMALSCPSVRAQEVDGTTGSKTQSDTARVFTPDNPLIYEDVWDLWPYAFLNDKGEPDGFNVDLVKMLMKELDIPYVIKLKPREEAYEDLKSRKSDLILGIATGFHDEYGLYSKNAVTLFTQSVLTPKSKPIVIKNFKDLGVHRVIVNDSSLCHHLMMDYGWARNAIPYDDMREAVQQLSETEDGQIVWNTLSLKWLLKKYQIENLELTPVNMPHGEYKFMSNNPQLLDRLDNAYALLYASERLTPIQNKWFYPDREEEKLPQWVIYAAVAAGVLLFILLVYGISYRIQAGQLTRMHDRRNKRLALIMRTSQVRIWAYNVKTDLFEWRNENGQVAYTYSRETFARRYYPADYLRLQEALDKLVADKRIVRPEDEENVTLNLMARDTEDGDEDFRDFTITLSVLRRDKHGNPDIIIGTKKDITTERERQRQADAQTIRYRAVFNNTMVGVLFFDKEGRLTDINQKACQIFCCKREDIVREGVTIGDILDTGSLPLTQVDGYCASQYVNIDRLKDSERKVKSIKRSGKLCNEFRLMTVYNDDHELLGIFAVCRDVTDSIGHYQLMAHRQQKLDASTRMLNTYESNINGVLSESDVRLASYSPYSHTLTIRRKADDIQHALTQTRCMTLVDDRSKKVAMRMLNDMDASVDKDINVDICTTLRISGGFNLCLQFSLRPQYDKYGMVREYLGLCRDVSEQRALERDIAQEHAKVEEVERTKSSFVKNMVQEIQTPMSSIVDYVGQLSPEQAMPDDAQLSQGILSNADKLLHLIDNILYLSRLEARMVDISRQPADLADVFESYCMNGWTKFRNEQTRYVAESPFERLVVNLDLDNLGRAVEQLTANAAQHTRSGVVRARYDYIGRRLSICVDDTGEGISQEQLELINRNLAAGTHNAQGLGLAICREIVTQLGGNMEVYSEEGSGTTVYIMIPCHASVVKRKHMN